MATYKAIINSPDYLIHFNKNHDPSSGRFTFGDGDGDGIVNENIEKMNLTKDEIEQQKAFRRTLGSKETQNQYDRASRSTTNREFAKELSKLEKMQRQDEKTAHDLGDTEAAKLITSGRMFLRAQVDGGYVQSLLNTAISTVIRDYGQFVTEGKDFTYSIDRDEKYGGLLVKLNDYEVHISDSKYHKEYDQAFNDAQRATEIAVRNHQDMVNQAMINEGQRFMEEMNRNQMQQQMFF